MQILAILSANPFGDCPLNRIIPTQGCSIQYRTRQFGSWSSPSNDTQYICTNDTRGHANGLSHYIYHSNSVDILLYVNHPNYSSRNTGNNYTWDCGISTHHIPEGANGHCRQCPSTQLHSGHAIIIFSIQQNLMAYLEFQISIFFWYKIVLYYKLL